MIPVNKFKLLGSDKKVIIKALNNNWISSERLEVKKFKDNFKKLIGKKY